MVSKEDFKMKSLFSKYIWLQFVLSILLMFGGALIIVFAALNKEQVLVEGLNIIAAVILFLFGLFAILASFAFERNRLITNGLVYGSASIAFGVFLCIQEFVLLNYLVYLLAIFFIVIGSVEIIKGIMMIIKKDYKKIGLIITFVIATLFIVGGILAIIYKENVRLAFCIIAGALVFLIGVYLLIFGIKVLLGQDKPKTKTPRKKKIKENNKPEEIKEIDYTAPEIEANKIKE